MSSKESKEEIPTSISSLEFSTKTLVDKQKSISIKAKVLLNNLELLHKSHTSFFKDIKTLSSSKDQQDEWLLHFDKAFCVCQTLCSEIVNFGMNKTAVKYIEKRLNAHNNHAEKLASVKQTRKGKITTKRQRKAAAKRKHSNSVESSSYMKEILDVSNQFQSHKKQCTISEVDASSDPVKFGYNLRHPKRFTPTHVLLQIQKLVQSLFV